MIIAVIKTIIRGYQIALSPLFPMQCRYLPTCSHYALEALETQGLLQGLKLSLFRLCRCHPLGGHGLDPVPSNQKVKK